MAGAGEGPRDQRVRVPHVACAELVATPRERRDVRQQREDGYHPLRIVVEALQSPPGLGEVRDGATRPAADLVAEGTEPTKAGMPDRTLAEHAPVPCRQVPHRPHLD